MFLPSKITGDLSSFFDLLEVWATEFAPLRHDDERIGALERVLGSLAQHEVGAFAVEAQRLLHCDRIVSTHVGARASTAPRSARDSMLRACRPCSA